jgi:hypothetical protein
VKENVVMGKIIPAGTGLVVDKILEEASKWHCLIKYIT